MVTEPCIILKLIRLLALESTKLSTIELYHLIVRLVSYHTPKDTFVSLEKNLNFSYRKEYELYSIPVIEANENVQMQRDNTSFSLSNFDMARDGDGLMG